MALISGAKLGPYEILRVLGAGGMGEVYRARDPRLGRDVALKILPDSFARDEDRLRRFEQETRAVAALNHPNILAIHDVGHHNGSPFLVFELLEGETLRAALGHGALSQRKAVEYGVQIAQGLAAAHEKGIVHRDLKPENLFLTRDGRVKILDFGLAKLAAKADGPPDGTTLTDSQTAAGTVIGTASYMAPEQVRGETIDPRTDIFAFGAVLFEMLSGQRAFSRDTTAETMTAVLKDDPPELIDAQHPIAPAVDRIVRRCLEKSPEQRFQSAKDLSFALAALSGSDSSGTAHAALTRRKMPPLLWMAMPLALALGAVATWLWAGRRPERKTAPVLHQLTFRRGTVWNARFAPDGNSVIYGAAWEGKPVEIFESRVDLAEARALGIAGADVLAISDKGEMAVTLRRKRGPSGFGFNGTLARLSLTGGAPRELMERVEAADWAPDGSLAISYHAQGKARLEFPIGTLRYESATWISHLRVSPNGGMVAFIDHDNPIGDGGAVRVVGPNLNIQLTRDYGSVQGLAWSPTGAEIWYTADEAGGSARSLHAVDLQGHDRILYRVPGTLKIQDIARDGRVLLVHELIWAGILAHVPGEPGERELGWLDWSIGRKLSDDGKWLLFDESGAAHGDQAWVYLRRTDGAPPVLLGEGAYCDLSTDGQWVAAALGDSSGQINLLPTSAGEARKLRVAGLRIYRVMWLPDREHVLLSASDAGKSLRGYIVDVKTAAVRPFTPEGVRLHSAVSPDGKFVAGVGADGRTYLLPLDGGPARSVGVNADERVIGWASDQKSLYVAAPGETGTSIYQVDIETGRRKLSRAISPFDKTGVSYIGPGYVTPDGRYYVYSYNRQISELFVVEGLK